MDRLLACGADKASLALSLGSVSIFLWRPLRQETVSVIGLLPSAILRIPNVGKLHDSARLSDAFKCLQRLLYNLALEFRLMRFTGLMSQREIDEYSPRRINRF